MSGRKRPHKSRSKAATQAPAPGAATAPLPTAAGSPMTAGQPTTTPPDSPSGPKTARPGKPGPAPARPSTPQPGPFRVRIVYHPVAATVLRTEPAEPAEPLAVAADAEGAFDALYLHGAAALRRQVAVLTGDRALAARAVRRGFDRAWQEWPEVARDSDPVGWVRAAAHAYALAPWRRSQKWRRPRRRRRKAPAPVTLPQALVRLHPERRRALLLHDGLGLSLAVAAAEVEASTTAVASRIIGARRELAAAAPDDYDGGDAATQLAALLAAEPDPPGGEPAPSGVRKASERRSLRRTAAGFAVAGGVALAITAGMIAGPHHGAPPLRGPAARHQTEPSTGG
ncbi:hypothetical protein [Streptomyces sp. NBC_01198]|uniref:hypothetical protein n=1 Tax=Streptomyces sp. NBC_01198 TaxID=2903769 RepID=UPI002E1278BD|nr:RNA polymerase subunit sigma-24 [Streptomyces sp. NBC_01198]